MSHKAYLAILDLLVDAVAERVKENGPKQTRTEDYGAVGDEPDYCNREGAGTTEYTERTDSAEEVHSRYVAGTEASPLLFDNFRIPGYFKVDHITRFGDPGSYFESCIYTSEDKRIKFSFVRECRTGKIFNLRIKACDGSAIEVASVIGRWTAKPAGAIFGTGDSDPSSEG